MPTAQLNIRLTPEQRDKINHNAQAYGKRPADYVRELIDREERYVSGEEIYQRILKKARKLRRAGVIPP